MYNFTCQNSLQMNIQLVSFISNSRRRQQHPTPVLLPGKSHGQRSLGGCSPWGHEESDTTERLHFHFSLSCIGEGNGNPLQCSCLENPRDGGAWWAAIYRVAQSWTRLKRLSSSSSISNSIISYKNIFSVLQCRDVIVIHQMTIFRGFLFCSTYLFIPVPILCGLHDSTYIINHTCFNLVHLI